MSIIYEVIEQHEIMDDCGCCYSEELTDGKVIAYFRNESDASYYTTLNDYRLNHDHREYRAASLDGILPVLIDLYVCEIEESKQRTIDQNRRRFEEKTKRIARSSRINASFDPTGRGHLLCELYNIVLVSMTLDDEIVTSVGLRHNGETYVISRPVRYWFFPVKDWFLPDAVESLQTKLNQ